jgi:hypothetical protein
MFDGNSNNATPRAHGGQDGQQGREGFESQQKEPTHPLPVLFLFA